MTKRVRRNKSATADTANAPVVSRFDLDAAGKFEGLPYVLSVEAVIKGEMPELGSSGMPPSLEVYVPASFRFWKAQSEARARDVRDQLVDAGVFVADEIAKVDGAHHKIVKRFFLAPVYEEKSDDTLILRPRLTALEHAATALVIEKDVEVVAFTGTTDDIAELGNGRWLLEMPNTIDAQKAALSKAFVTHAATVFTIDTRPDALFLTNVHVAKVAHVSVIDPAITKRAIKLLKADVPEGEERYALGIVLEPDTVDSQNDTYDAATIRAAAHKYMEDYTAVGLQHESIVTGKVKILESYIAPVDFTIGTEVVKAGTWLMAFRFIDDAIWEQVKNGELTGLSIGGSAIREPVV